MAGEEHNTQKEIQVALSRHKCSVFRTNVGKVQTIDHRWFDTGLPQGFPDLMGFRWVDNQIFFIEVKSKTGKPRPDQLRFHKFLESHDVIQVDHRPDCCTVVTYRKSVNNG